MSIQQTSPRVVSIDLDDDHQIDNLVDAYLDLGPHIFPRDARRLHPGAQL